MYSVFLYLLAAVAVSSAQFIPSSGPVYVNPNAAVPSFDLSEAPVGDRTTQTVYGFLDFTTTIGNTVMVFSPQSAAAAEKKTEKPTTQSPIIETKAPSTPHPEIQPSKTIKAGPESKAEAKKEVKKQTVAPPAVYSVVEVIGGDVAPSKVQEPPLVLSSKVEVKESPPMKIKKPSTKPAPFIKVEVRDDKNQIVSSKVEIKSQPSKAPIILSSKVQVLTNDKPVLSSKVQVLTNQKPASSVVHVLTSDSEEPAIEVDANNIDKPEYDFLNRQPSEIVDENYKVIDLKPQSKFQLKAKTRQQQNPSRATGLVTKMGGTIVKDGVTTVHETEVIGTYISGKYAQVLQSTARVIPRAPKISPTQTARILKTAAPSIPKGRVQLEPTPAGSLHEETALPLEALFHGDKNHIRPSRRPGPAVGGPSSKNEVKGKYRLRNSKEQETSSSSSSSTQEEDDDVEEYSSKRKFRPSSSAKQSFSRFGKSSSLSVVPTVSVYSESSASPSGRKYQNSGRRANSGSSNNFKSKVNHEKDDSSARRGYKPKLQPSSPDSSGGTSLYKFKLQRPSGRWQYKTTPKPRVTIRGRPNDEQNEVATSPSPPTLVGIEDDAERREDISGDETAPVEPSVTASTIKVSISTPPDFSDTYYEIATVKSPYVFQAGTLKNTRFITVTTTIEKTLQSIEPTLPVIAPASTEPLTENILASSSPVYEKENGVPLDSSIATLPPISLGTDVETPPLETLTETFSTTQMLLKTHILPVIRGGSDTTSYTLVQSYQITRLVTATKTLPPMEVYQFVPSKTLKEFNSRLDEAGSELHLELDFGDDGNQEDDDDSPPGIRALAPDLDLANIGNDFDVSSVDATKLAEALRQAKLLRKSTTPKPTTEAPTTPALPPEQLQQLALLRLLNPNAQLPQLLTSSKPVVKVETIWESHVIPIINGASTSFSTLSRPLATVTKTDYEAVTTTATPALPLLTPTLNPFLPQFTLTSTPVVTNAIVTATESKVLKLTFGAKTAYTTLYSTRVVPTVLTTYLTTNVPVAPTAAAFPGYFPGAFPGFPGFLG